MNVRDEKYTPAVCVCVTLGVADAAATLSSSWRDRLITDGCVVATCELAGCAALVCNDNDADAAVASLELAGCAALVCNDNDADAAVASLEVRMLFPRTTSLSPTYTQPSIC